MDLPTFNILSLCTGAGGLDLGVALAVPSARTVCCVEYEAYACEVLACRMEEEALDPAPIWTDLRTFDGKPWRGVVDCVIGGYPCQPFSVAGRKLGEEDPRHLWPQVARILREVRPAFAFFENVSNHLNMGYRDVRRELEETGYRVKEGLFTAEEVGAPHRRERLFVLAYAYSKLYRHRHARKAAIFSDSFEETGVSGRQIRVSGFWSAEPELGRVAHGVPQQVDRIRLCGNGVVPLAAAYAFRTLAADLLSEDDG